MEKAWKPTTLTQPNNPPRPGVYERKFEGHTSHPYYQHWNGEWWGQYGPSIERAQELANNRSGSQSGSWRELPGEDSFEDAATPLIRWLNANGHPHMTVIVDQTHAELLEGQKSFVTHAHVRD